jgi:hypothetical protein
VETSKRKDLLTSMLNGFGIRRDGDALLLTATPQDFSLGKHSLVQASSRNRLATTGPDK